MAIVFFDVDNTLLEGQSQKYFLKYLLSKNVISRFAFLKINIWYVFYKIGLADNPAAIMEYAFSFAKGKDVSQLRKLAKDFFENHLHHYLFPEALALLQKHQGKGHRVVLLSNAVEFLVAQIAYHAGVNGDYIATKLESREGIFTGKMLGEPVYGLRKVELARDFMKQNQTSGPIWAYADHASDTELLEFADHAYAVNPDKKLKIKAKKNNWEILNFKRT